MTDLISFRSALEFFAVTLGQAIGSISPSVYIAAMQNPFLLVLVRSNLPIRQQTLIDSRRLHSSRSSAVLLSLRLRCLNSGESGLVLLLVSALARAIASRLHFLNSLLVGFTDDLSPLLLPCPPPTPLLSTTTTNEQMYPLDPVTRFIAGMVSTELHQLPIVCQPRELVTFIPPMGQTCQQWAGEFVTLAGGYIVNPLSTTACEYCQFAVGNEFYEPLLVSFDDRWRDLGILFAFCVSNAIITITATKYLVRSFLFVTPQLPSSDWLSQF